MATDPNQMPDTIQLTLTDEDSGETLYSAQLVWKGGTRGAPTAGTGPIDLDDPAQSLIEVRDERWNPGFRAVQDETKALQKMRGAASGLDVAKFAWDIIKHSKPVTQASGAFTAVLSSGDKNWDHYSGAKEFTSPKFDWHGSNLFGMTLFRAKHILKGTYAATYSGKAADVPAGRYLPLVFFDIPEAFAAATWGLTGSASASNPSNVGSADAVVPMVYISAQFTASGWFQSFTKSFSYKVRGDSGYAGKA